VRVYWIKRNEAILFCSGLAGRALLGAEPTDSVDAAAKVAVVRADPSSGGWCARRGAAAGGCFDYWFATPRKKRPAPAPLPVSKLAADASVLEIIDHTAKLYKVDPLLVHSVIQVESGYNRYALSNKGAQGMMQLIPSTARSLGVKNPFDAKENIEAGVRYLKQLQMTFKDDRLALAAYNAGPGAVSKYGTIPPYAETQNYVYQVGKRLGNARRAQQSIAAAPATEAPKQIEQFVDEEGRLHLRLK
jgi:soluble lytic murein transglycosylase-like protein